MSLSVYLTTPNSKYAEPHEAIFVRRDGAIVEISREEWDSMFPDREPVVAMIDNICMTNEVYWGNITHNLGEMASQAGIYMHLWRPEEIGVTKAVQLIEPLTDGLERLVSCPHRFIAFNPANGWGSYDGFIAFVANYLNACRTYPEADVRVSR